MKSLITLLQCVLKDLGTRCGTSTARDLKEIESRVEHEGYSFLGITMANFGRDLEKALDQGFVDPTLFAGFRRRGGLPLFLGGFLDRVFERSSGLLLDEPCISSIHSLRQITLMWKKMEDPDHPVTPARVRKAMARYVEIEQDVRRSDLELFTAKADLFEDYCRIGRLLWADFFSAVDTCIYNEVILPKHGPGGTADKLRGNAKYKASVWHRRLEDVFPHWEHVIPSERFLSDIDHFRILDPGEEIPVLVISVPKTRNTTRIIAAEPTHVQYMQQGVLSVIMQKMACFDKTANFVMFEEQEHNRKLALEGSIHGNLATLDLSEASDRVSNQHVRALLANHPNLFGAVDATRSRKADIQGYGVKRLAKYASMGSALCFPFEAIVFATLVFLGIERTLGRPLTEKDVTSFFGKVRVYGDDIVVPVEYVQSVIECLEAFGLKVNSDKSFWTGKFRESCGKDYYDGNDVSIIRYKSPLLDRRRLPSQVVSTVDLRNKLFLQGFFPRTVEFLDRHIERFIPFPVVEQNSPVLGRLSYGPCQPERQCPRTHKPLVRGVVVKSVLPNDKLEDYGALMKWFLMKQASDRPTRDKDHLLKAGRPVVNIKTGWFDPHAYGEQTLIDLA